MTPRLRLFFYGILDSVKRTNLLWYLAAFAIIYVLFLALPFILFPGSVGGSFGIRPQSHRCLGISLSAEQAAKIFPQGEVRFQFLGKRYEYRIDPDWDRTYCAGQDIWYGE